MRQARLSTIVVSCFAGLLLAAAPAMAETQAPRWTVTSVSLPTNFAPGDQSGEDSFRVVVTNTGGASSNGSAIKIVDELPEGLSPDSADPLAIDVLTHSSANFSCTLTTCTYSGSVIPDQSLEIHFPVDVAAGPLADSCEVPAGAAGCLTNIVRVHGGGAEDASVSTPTVISEHPATFGISPGGASTALSTEQAGAHPDITTSIAFNTVNRKGVLAADPKDLITEEPPGFAGDLIDTASCSPLQLSLGECPIDTQVGVVTLSLLETTDSTPHVEVRPVYNLTPNPGQVAKFGFNVANSFFIQGNVSLRPGDYGLRVAFHNTNEVLSNLDSASLTIWGVPAFSVHNPLRWSGSPLDGHFGTPSEVAPAPFFTNPTSCGAAPLEATFSASSWQEPEASAPARMPFGPIVGCDRLTIEPTMEVQPTSSSAESATGLDVRLHSPQHYDNPGGLVSSNLDGVKVTLPEGMNLNPSAGSGLGSCTQAQFAYEGSTFEPTFGLGCPNESKVGTVKVKSPALAEEAKGSLFVAKPFENPFGSLLALYLVARIPDRGVVATAAGEVHADPVTGQLTTTFDENPQVPFSDFALAFKQGATSPLATPPACGAFTANADLTPWSVPDQHHPLSSPFSITSGVRGGPCPTGGLPPFHPGLLAGSINPVAGAYTPFYIRLSREDGEQEITHFSIKLPPGVIGKLAGIPLCTDAQVAQAKSREHEQGGAVEEANPSCPAGSEVGRTLVEAGVGTTLAQAPGKIYLAGPYHGSAISVVAITSAKVGPFDLGTVVVREALKVNPETGEVFVDSTGSDPLPHIVDGIPTHLRNVRIYMDRPEFVLNPTSCEPTSTASTVLGSGLNFASEADDRPITVTSPFEAVNCAKLKFKPKLKLSLKGSTKRGGHPSFRAELTMKPGEANVGKAQVTLPHSEFLANAHIGTVCTRVQFNAGKVPGEGCPAASVYGHARAITPILDQPLEGPVYLRSSEHKLPDLVAALNNGEINIALDGRIDSINKGQIRNTFETVPDAPVSKFVLTMDGGGKGLLENSTNLCAGTHRAIANFTGQNGKERDFKPALQAKCGGGGKKKGKHHRR